MYKGKNILITGASSGIGKELSLQLSKQGANLILASRDESKLKQVKEQCQISQNQIHIYSFDASKSIEVSRLITFVKSTFDRLDVLILNAGLSQRSLTLDTTLEVDRYIMEVNYFSQIALTKGLFEMMKASISPSSVVMSSLSGLFGFPLRSAYCASKHALHGFYETLQLETIQTNTHTMLVCPGRIKTDISFSALDGEGNAYNKQSLGQLKGLDVSVCADKIIKGIKNKNKILLITKEEIILYYIKKIIPSLFYKIASKIKND